MTKTQTPQTETGKWITCSRCHGTGEARFNHLNGDTHCYLCDGRGLVYRASAAEKAREEADQDWARRAYAAEYDYRLQVRRAIRKATGGDQAASTKLYRALLVFGGQAAIDEANTAAHAAREAQRLELLRTTLAAREQS